MKCLALALFSLLICSYPVFSQKDRWLVKAGEDVNTVLPNDIKFQYPQFTAGVVLFRDGNVSNALLNYNRLADEMQFIAPKGDTLAVANEVTIKEIIIGSDTFYYDKKYLQFVAGNTTATLVKKATLGIADVKKKGGYDQASSTAAITPISSLRVNGQFTKLTENQEILILIQTSYFIGDAYNHFLPANKKNFIKLFGEKQNSLERYFKDNKVNFSKEADLKALIAFLEN